ncbi:hypothetical protein Y032_0771g2219, partial [Ancylostoma ceylanicum]
IRCDSMFGFPRLHGASRIFLLDLQTEGMLEDQENKTTFPLLRFSFSL